MARAMPLSTIAALPRFVIRSLGLWAQGLAPRHASLGLLWRCLAIAATVFVIALLGILMTRASGRIAAVWLANGLAVALLLRRPQHEWSMLLLAGLAGNVLANLAAGDILLDATLLSLLNALEISLVVTMTASGLDPDRQFETRSIGRFLGAAMVGPLAPSVISATWFMARDGLPFTLGFASWYGADVLGLLIVSPILLAVRPLRHVIVEQRPLEALLIPLVASGLAALVFAQGTKPLLFLLAPVVLFAAFRLRLLPAMLTVAVVAAFAIAMTTRGQGPIAATTLDPVDRIYVLQAFLATLVMLVLPVAAVIGERDQLGVAADHSDRLFHRIAEATPAGILHVELDGTISFANDRWVELTGLQPTSLADAAWLDPFHPDDRDLIRETWQRASTLHQAAGGEIRFLDPLGAICWAEYSFYPELADGRLHGFIVKLFDVTHRHAVEQALQESESLYRLLAENSLDIIVRLTLDGRTRYVSNAATRLFGFEPGDLMERPMARFIHPDDLPDFQLLFPSANHGNGEAIAQFRHRRRSGDYVWLEASARTTVDPATGEPSELIASLRDISARRHADHVAADAAAKLRESNRLLTLAESLADVGHWRFDIATQGFDCSPQVNVITDIPRDQPIGPTEILNQVDRHDRRAVLRTLVLASRRRVPIQETARLTLAHEIRHVCLVAQAEHDAAGTLTGLFGVIQDISKSVTVQAELVGARDEAQAAARAKSDFLSTMSHEIRTPMTGVLGMIELLRDNPAPEERDRFFITLKQSADLLMTVLDDVLDFSRIESGRLVFEDADFDIEELMQSTIDLFDGAASQKGLLLGFEGDRGAATRVRGDAVRVQQVVSNLISNAIKFTAVGRITLMLSARPAAADAAPDALCWRIEVRDTGIGIPADKLGSLFEPFVQADAATSRRFGGSGLGLAISRRLVDAMGGKAGVRSRPGRGSTFWIELTLAAGTGEDVTKAPTEIVAGPRALDVLVAEDNPINQMIIGAILRRFGHHVTCVENGYLALEQAGRRLFDVVLMDMQMPEMDGLAATRAIRNLPPPHGKVPIIALTADASSERRRFYDGAGLTDFLTKPIDRHALADRLNAIGRTMAVAETTASADPDPVVDEFGGRTAATGATARQSASDPSDPGEPFDVARYEELRESLGGAQVRDLLDLLAQELGRCPARIRACIERGDLDAARAEAHSLKGAASNLGATALGRVAAVIESAAITGQPELEALDTQARRTVKAIAALR